MTISASLFAFVATWFLLWRATGHTPFLLLARLFMFLEVAFSSAFEIAWLGMIVWHQQLKNRYVEAIHQEARRHRPLPVLAQRYQLAAVRKG